MWGYSELGRALAAAGLPAEPRYRRWIETYADPEFAGLAAWCAELLDRAADGLPAARLAACTSTPSGTCEVECRHIQNTTAGGTACRCSMI